LKFKHVSLLTVIVASWGIAFFEYCLMVPANRLGSCTYSAAQLKIIQEVITLAVFSGFALMYLGEKIRWIHLAAIAGILGNVVFTFLPKEWTQRSGGTGLKRIHFRLFFASPRLRGART
jgi:uncharacterized protein (DUF486 family)